jgi:hypothetical protein
MIELTTDAVRSARRCITKATSAENKTINVTEPTVKTVLFHSPKHTVVAKHHDFPQVLEELKLAGPTELEEGSFWARLGGRQKDKYERDDKHDTENNQRDGIDPGTGNKFPQLHSSSSNRLKNRISGYTMTVTRRCGALPVIRLRCAM